MIATAIVQITETDRASCRHFETLSVSMDVEELRKREPVNLPPGTTILLPQVTGFCITATGSLLFRFVESEVSFSAKSVHLFSIEKTDVEILNEGSEAIIVHKAVLM